MKKKALCIFILIFWLVGACTFLSAKIEEQMIPQVTTVEASGGFGDSKATLPLDCLIMDETGMHLYSLYEGTGWEAGSRVEESRSSYMITDNGLELDGAWGKFVQYASKPLKPGELINEVRGGTSEADQWLAVFPDSAPELNELPAGMDVVERNSGAVQIAVEKSIAPFMEARAKSLIPELAEAKVYSFSSMTQFLDNFTGFACLLFLLFAALALWACSCLFAKHARENRAVLLINLAVGIFLLACVPLVLQSIDLPSSLLPREHITDFGYYAQEMDEFFGSLTSFAPAASSQGYLAPNLPQTPEGQAIIQHKNILIARPVLYGVGGLAAGLLLAGAEYVALRVRRRPRIK